MSNKCLNFRVLAILLAFLNCSRVSGLYGWGPCPSIPIDIEQYVSSKNDYFVYSLGDFRAEDYLGTWYDILRNADFPWSKGNCTKNHYYIRDDGRLGFLGSEIVNGKNISVEAEVFIDLSIPGQLWVKFFRFAPLGDYKVIHTDYKRSALVLSCKSFWIFHRKFAWIIARDFNIEVPSYYKIIESLGIPMTEMIKTNHKNC